MMAIGQLSVAKSNTVNTIKLVKLIKCKESKFPRTFCSMLKTESVVVFRQKDTLENDDIAVHDFVFKMKSTVFGIL